MDQVKALLHMSTTAYSGGKAGTVLLWKVPEEKMLTGAGWKDQLVKLNQVSHVVVFCSSSQAALCPLRIARVSGTNRSSRIPSSQCGRTRSQPVPDPNPIVHHKT